MNIRSGFQNTAKQPVEQVNGNRRTCDVFYFVIKSYLNLNSYNAQRDERKEKHKPLPHFKKPFFE